MKKDLKDREIMPEGVYSDYEDYEDIDFNDLKPLDENQEIGDFARKCYYTIDSFYGVFYDNYQKLSKLLCFRVPFTLIWIGVVFFLCPFVYKQSGLWLPLFPFAVVTFMNIGVYCMFRNKPLQMFYYRTGNKSVAVYWKKNKKYLIVHFGTKQQFKYYFKEQIWEECDEDLSSRKLYFNHIKDNISVKKSKKGITTIIARNNKKHPKWITAELNLSENNTPLDIEFSRTVVSYRSNSFSKGEFTSTNRLEFVEINSDRFIEIPKSFVTYCAKNNIEAPEENEFLHYV